MQSDVVMWSLVVGFVTPLVTAIIVQSHWSSGAKAILNFVVAGIGACGVQYFEGNLDWNHNLVSTILFVAVTSIAAYHGLLRPTAVAPAVETATNVTTPAAGV
jgi:hypothetical protein